MEISSNCSEHVFHFSPQMDRVSLSHDSSGNEKKLLKCDINGLQEALVFQDTHTKIFYFKVTGGKGAFQMSRNGDSK